MIHFSNETFPTDFSESSREALKHAIRICKTFGAKLHILHVNVMSGGNPDRIRDGFPEIEKLIDYNEREAEREFQQYRKLSDEHVVLFSESVVRGFSVAEEILRFEEDKKIDLIVMGTQGRSFLGSIVLGSVAEKVVRYSSCPVMTVNKLGGSIDIVKDYKKILVPLDFSEYSKAGLRYGIAFAKTYSAKLEILHCFEQFQPPLIYAYGAENMLDFNPEIRTRSEEKVRETVAEIDPKFTGFSVYVTEGKPNREIVDRAAATGADLIVLSTRGLGTVQAFFIGSTADKVIRKAQVPVLSVKEHERSFIKNGSEKQQSKE